MADNWDRSGSDRVAWLERVVDSGWAAPKMADRVARPGARPSLSRFVDEEFRAAGVTGASQDMVNLWANALLAFGSDDPSDGSSRPLMLCQVDICCSTPSLVPAPTCRNPGRGPSGTATSRPDESSGEVPMR